MRVAIVGAGMGGMTLAHFFVRRGFEVQVFERDGSAGDTAGYRLHLGASATKVLRDALGPEHFQALVASSTGGRALSQFAVMDHRGRTLIRLPEDEGSGALLIGRRPLRRLLARGLAGRIRWGCSFVGYEYTEPGALRVDLDDGSSVHADLLVGADGTFSRVARRLTGRATAAYAGVSAIAGRTNLSNIEAPPDLAKGPAFVIGPDGVGAFLSVHSLEPEDRLTVLDGSAPEPADLEESYLVWSIAAPGPEPESHTDNGEAYAAALRSIASWSWSLRSLVEASDPTSVTRFAFYRDTGLTPHPARKVALLGDAIHPMPPTGGAGASTAIRDAECLNRHVLDDPDTLPLSIYEYQREMLAYARETSSESLLPLRIQRRTSGNLPRLLLTRLALPAAQAAFNARALLRGD